MAGKKPAEMEHSFAASADSRPANALRKGDVVAPPTATARPSLMTAQSNGIRKLFVEAKSAENAEGSLDGSSSGSSKLLQPLVLEPISSPAIVAEPSPDQKRDRRKRSSRTEMPPPVLVLGKPVLDLEWMQLSGVLEIARGRAFVWYSGQLGERAVTATIAKFATLSATGAAAAVRMETSISVMAQLNHPNVLPLLAAGFTPGGHRFMVVPACPRGTLAALVDSGVAYAIPSAGSASGPNSAGPLRALAAAPGASASVLARTLLTTSSANVPGMSPKAARASGGSASARTSPNRGDGGRFMSTGGSRRSSPGGGGGLFASVAAFGRRGSASQSPARQQKEQQPERRRRNSSSSGAKGEGGDGGGGGGGGSIISKALRFSFTDSAGAAAAALEGPLRAALGVAMAMEYLQEDAVPGSIVLHRDLRPDHVMVERDGTVRVSGFGRSVIQPRILRDPNTTYALQPEVGAPRYMAPEVALGLPYNGKADVYSFAVMTWELVARQRPFSGMRRTEMWGRVVMGKQRPPLDPEWPEELRTLLSRSWDSEPELRPNFHEAVGILRGIVDTLIAAQVVQTPEPGLGSFFSSLFS